VIGFYERVFEARVMLDLQEAGLRHFSFSDPDAGRHEVVWKKPAVPVESGLRRDEWKMVTLD
jgi:hypothetical protein